MTEAQTTRVGEIMSHPAVCARPDMSVETVVELMLKNGFSRLPVVDSDEKLVGMVSKTDLVAEQFLRGETSEWVLEEGVPLAEQGFHLYQPGAAVADVMKPAIVTVSEDTAVGDAAQLLVIHQLHGAPVVSGTDRVKGMVSLTDIVGWIAGLTPS